jgi:hypothetical protein
MSLEELKVVERAPSMAVKSENNLVHVLVMRMVGLMEDVWDCKMDIR